MEPTEAAKFAVIVIGSTASLALIGVAVHFYWTRMSRRTLPAPPPPLIEDRRLDRLEQAVDAIAVELERVSEGQRFLTNLQVSRPVAEMPSRITTPVQ